MFLSTVSPFSQEVSRLFLQTQVFDSSNNLLINNKEAFSRKDYNQADFALPKSMRASAIDFQVIPARLNITLLKTLFLAFPLAVKILPAYSMFLTVMNV